MATKSVHHVVKRPGRNVDDPEIEIPVAEDLVTMPGTPLRERDVSYYSREHPLEAHFVENSADREWLWMVYSEEFASWRRAHEEREDPLVKAAEASGNVKLTATADPNRNSTEDILGKARALGFSEVGFTGYDRRYTYGSKKRWVKFPHAICLALEQDYVPTQSIPSEEVEHAQ